MDISWCPVDLRPLLEAYLTRMKNRHYSHTTVDTNRKNLKPFFLFMAALGIARLQDVTLDHLNAYRLRMVRRRLAGVTIYDRLSTLRLFFRYLELEQTVFINPARSVLMPKYQRHLKSVPTEEEVKRLLAQPDVSDRFGLRDRALIEVAYSTGARVDEIVRMNLLSFDRAQQSIRILGKGRKERILPLGRQAMFWLETYLKNARPRFAELRLDEPALWLRSCGLRMPANVIFIMLRKYSAQAGIQPAISSHAIRRACASHMLRRGAHPVQIQTLLGHSTLDTLSRYLRVTIVDLQKSYQRSKPAR